MRISDWSSDVCSSDLHERRRRAHQQRVYVDRERLHEALLRRMLYLGRGGRVRTGALAGLVGIDAAFHTPLDRQAEHRAEPGMQAEEIGSASSREKVGQDVSIPGVAVSKKKKTKNN